MYIFSHLLLGFPVRKRARTVHVVSSVPLSCCGEFITLSLSGAIPGMAPARIPSMAPFPPGLLVCWHACTGARGYMHGRLLSSEPEHGSSFPPAAAPHALTFSRASDGVFKLRVAGRLVRGVEGKRGVAHVVWHRTPAWHVERKFAGPYRLAR